MVRPLYAVTDNAGSFVFPKLPPGLYPVTVTAQGFRSLKEADIAVAVSRPRDLTLSLEAGGVSESVTITARAGQVDTTARRRPIGELNELAS